MSIFEDLRSRVIRGITTDKDKFIFQQFARHGYSRSKVMELIEDKKLIVIQSVDPSFNRIICTFVINGEPTFKIIERYNIEWILSRADIKITCEDITYPLCDSDGVGMTLGEFMEKYDFDFADIILKYHDDGRVIRDPGCLISNCEVMSVNGNIVTVR